MKCPKWHEIDPTKGDPSNLPLNIKPEVINSVKLQILKALEMHPKHREELLDALRWVEDPTKFEEFGVPLFRKYTPRLSRKDLRLVHRKLRRIASKKCSVRAFSVPEWHKWRRRPIFWPDINDLIPKSALKKSTLPLKAAVRQASQEGNWSIQYDFKSWFDQIPLTEGVSEYFYLNEGYALGQLVMGFRAANEVAQAITTALASFTLPNGTVATIYIDNVRFTGKSKADVEAAGKEFVARCRKVGAILGDYDPVAMQEDDFLGERYDHVNKTRSLTKKTSDKVAFVKENILQLSTFDYRRLAAFFGVLFYASEVAQAPLCKYYKALQYFRKAMSQVQGNWDQPHGIPIDNHTTYELIQWCNFLLENKPVPICPKEHPDRIRIHLDASNYGWGATSEYNGTSKQFAARWSPQDWQQHNLHSSVTSEPLGTLRAVQAIITRATPCVEIHTDHQPLVFAGNKEYGKAFTYNELIRTLKEQYPNTKFIYHHIKGKDNVIADALSRGIMRP